MATSSTEMVANNMVLPGYEAGIGDSGMDHSHKKLAESSKRLESLLRDQAEELDNECHPLRKSITVHTLPCLTEAESWAYRCRCNFQIVCKTTTTTTTTDVTTTSSGPPSTTTGCGSQATMTSTAIATTAYQYAMRHRSRPISIGTYRFPIATHRIQRAMEDLMELVLNHRSNVDDDDGSGRYDNTLEAKTADCFPSIRQHLTSCTFSSAWYDSDGVDCILTLHYDHPLDGPTWTEEAKKVCTMLRLRRLNGRSRGVIVTVMGVDTDHDVVDNKVGIDSSQFITGDTIRDTVYLCRRDNDDEWVVSLDCPGPSIGGGQSTTTTPDLVLPVRYEKPETAFYHPNASAMVKALKWMLNRLTEIQYHRQKDQYQQPQQQQQQRQQIHAQSSPGGLRLLEMYCGCGAHTVALGRTGLLSKILAVELDPRLVQACLRNVELNNLQALVEVRRGDAGQWAKDEEHRRRRWTRQHETLLSNDDESSDQRCTFDDDSNVFNILLVDPPRQGLDDHVCQMAIAGTTYEDFLYISCGHQALLRDLEKLAPIYEVIHCVQMDLFPRTDSIETLVHLRRKR